MLKSFSNFVEPAWSSPTLGGAWTNTGAPYQTTRYSKRSPGVVYIEGMVTGGAAGSVIFNLPAGFRPAARLNFPSANGLTATAATIRVDPNGDVLHISGTTSNITLNICFSV
jgi:hypothetical protein